MKFGRTYRVTAEGRSGTVHTIAFPLTCRFRVIQSSLFTSGEAIVQLYNLRQDVRNDLYKDAFEASVYKPVTLAAGYRNALDGHGAIELPLIFRGNIIQAESYRQGPDWITELHALDGGWGQETGAIDLTLPSPYTFRDAVQNAIAAMGPTVSVGRIGTFPAANARGVTISGNPWDWIVNAVKPYLGQAFINKERVFVIQQWEVIEDQGALEVISAETGMIGTPRVQSALVKARMIFEPRLEIAQSIQIDTSALPAARTLGTYKVLRITHAGTISGAVAEDLVTEVELYQPDRVLVAA